MNESIYWIKIVLHKLYELHLDDTHYEGYWWSCEWDEHLSVEENIENTRLEIKALYALSNAGVIDLAMMKNDRGEPSRKTPKGFAKYTEEIPVIVEYNSAKFSDYCRMIGFNPSDDSLRATFELDSIVPVVKVGDQIYRLSPLKDESSVHKAVRYCLNHDGIVKITDLKQIIPTLENINQLLKGGPFDKAGSLGCFVITTPNTLKVMKSAKLSRSQLSQIRTKSV